jgi:hypothetical protein
MRITIPPSRKASPLDFDHLLMPPFYSNSQLTLSDPSEPVSKQAVILHDAPSTLPTSTVTQLTSTDGINRIFITDALEATNPYDTFPSYWTSFVNAVGTAAGGC